MAEDAAARWGLAGCDFTIIIDVDENDAQLISLPSACGDEDRLEN
jgi:hypothetical protein